MRKIIIYGASTSALNILHLLKSQDIVPYCFVVSKLEGNPAEVENIPVYVAEENLPMNRDAFVLMAIPQEACREVGKKLEEIGVLNYLPAGLDSWVDVFLRKRYFLQNNFMKNTDLLVESDYENANRNVEKTDVIVYKVKHHRDKVVKDIVDEGYISSVQAGAENTELRIANNADNVGEHISERNCNYSELTALYWVWKNCKLKEYVGLCHYRRKFRLKEHDIQNAIQSEYDMIVPLPGLYMPNTKEAFIQMKKGNPLFVKDWEYMMEGIEKCCPEYMDTARAVESGFVFYHYNMLIARKEIFCEWCKFLFDVLFCVEDVYKKIGIVRNDRYLGYLAEVLTTIYIMHHQEYKKAYSDLIFLE